MISWSTKRQLSYLSILLIILLLLIVLPTLFLTYQAPSCTDGKQNQGELGADCGGPCSILCKASALELNVHWQRAFKVKAGVYNAIAYVENSNLDSGADIINYTFKLYDSENFLIYERNGNTFVPPKKIFGIFESNLLTGTRIPARTTFEYTHSPWRRDLAQEKLLTVTKQDLLTDMGTPRLTASLENNNLETVRDIEVVALVYDEEGNVIGTSRTVVDSIAKDSSAPLIFTWPEAFLASSSRTELIYRFLR